MKKTTGSKHSSRSGAAAHKGLLLFEWVVMAYAVFTLILMALMYSRLQNPMSMLMLRVQTIAITLALWGVYRMMPCRLLILIRVVVQMSLLSAWYPDTFEFNRVLPNLDHVFAAWEQQVFGCQPALLFSQYVSSPIVSELLTLSYLSYFPLMALVPLFFFFFRKELFLRTTFIVVASFFVFYVVFLFLPVAGPQYYYLAAGLDNVARGVFPDVGNYFLTHTEPLPLLGTPDGIFHQLLQTAHETGERPTAAFPSSHMGVTTVILFLAWSTKNRLFFWSLLPFGVLMFFSTFYLQAHYAIDAIAGVVAGILLYYSLNWIYDILSRHSIR